MTVEDGGCEFETTYHDQTWQEQCSFMLWSLRVLVKNEYLLLPEDSILESSVGPTLGWKEVLWSPFFLPRLDGKTHGNQVCEPSVWFQHLKWVIPCAIICTWYQCMGRFWPTLCEPNLEIYNHPRRKGFSMTSLDSQQARQQVPCLGEWLELGKAPFTVFLMLFGVPVN